MSLPGLAEVRDWCLKEDLAIADADFDRLTKYLDLLRLWSSRSSLIGPAEVPVLATKHLADCLAAAAHCPHEGRLADLGSGGGLPGIPIAITRPNLQVDLVESREKKLSFLTQAASKLKNANPLCKRIEDLERGVYDCVIARALAPMDRLLPLAHRPLRMGGTLLAMKSASYQSELKGQKESDFGFSPIEAIGYTLPSGHERVLLKLSKSASTKASSGKSQ